MTTQILSGKVIKVNKTEGTPNPNSYVIEGEDHETYLVHIGDIKENEDLLYSLYKKGEIAILEENDLVVFEPQRSDKTAIKVRKKP